MKFRQSLAIIYFQVGSQLKQEATRGYIGYLWWVIEPLLYLGALYIAFSSGLKGQGRSDFMFFLLGGLLPWKWFATTINQSCRSIIAGRGLINQVYIPKYIFPAVIVFVNAFKFSVVFLFFLVLVNFAHKPLDVNVLWLFYVVFVQVLLILGMSFLVAAFIPFLPDFKLLIENAIMFLFFVSGIFFRVREVPGVIGEVLAYNPVSILVTSYRVILLEHQTPDLFRLTGVAFAAAFLLLVALTFLLKMDRKYPKVVF